MNKLRTGQVPAATNYQPALERLDQVSSTPWARGKAVRDAFTGSSTPVVTLTLLFSNIAVFVAGIALSAANGVSVNDYLTGGDNNGSVAAIQHQLGFLNGADVYVRNEWWRLITACFNHIGWVHLAVNMYSLFVVGPLLERLWGRGRFLTLYFLSGLAGSCGMLIENPTGGGAGASGAIWGIMASLATWIYLNRQALPGQLIAAWRGQLITVFVLNMFITFGFSGISKGGHFGGGIVGLITAIPLDYFKLGTPAQRRLAFVALVAIPVVCIALVLRSFVYTGPLIALQDSDLRARKFYNARAVPLFSREQNWDRMSAEKIAISLAEHQTKLEKALDTPFPRAPFWLPQRQDQWSSLESDAKTLVPVIARARAEIQRRLPRVVE